MQRIETPLGEWLPSAPTWKNPGLVDCRGVIPSPGGYKPFRGVIPSPGGYKPFRGHRGAGDSVAAQVLGAQTFYKEDGSVLVVGGTATTLFSGAGATIAATTGLTALGAGNYWDFAQFNDYVIATGGFANPVKSLDDVNSDTSWADLAGTPPRARYAARVGDFVVLGNIHNSPNRIHWSGLNNPTTWAPDRLTQAGFLNLPQQYGAVQRIVGGRYSIVFQERGILRLDFVGPPVVFQATEIERDRGCIAPFSVATVGFQTAFLAQDGFFLTNGSAFQPIGTERVNRWFFETVEQSRLVEVHAAIDWQNECFVWAFPSQQCPEGQFDRVLFFSWTQNRWSYGVLAGHRLVTTKVAGFVEAALDALYPGGLETIPGSPDDPIWGPKEQILGAFVIAGTGSQFGYFDGDPVQAVFETGDLQPAAGRRVFVSEGWPIVNGPADGAEMAVVTTANDGAVTAGAYSPQGAAGFCPLRADARAMRLRMRIPAGATWRDATAMQVAFRVSGAR